MKQAIFVFKRIKNNAWRIHDTAVLISISSRQFEPTYRDALDIVCKIREVQEEDLKPVIHAAYMDAPLPDGTFPNSKQRIETEIENLKRVYKYDCDEIDTIEYTYLIEEELLEVL